ncbi:MAG: ribosome biogenesis GTP-binding protein YihA/YsxC [Oscillospiraceae bacterium]|nr:ribosome biogenesis GTP-binding protein YihA/YsxC [Oscillospiraceae bacterium]
MNFNNADFFHSYGVYSQIPPSDRVEIAMAGRSNVGKSSLINKALNRKSLARVSSVPGKTATINFYDLDGIYLVDLPGYGYAKVAKSEKARWAELIEGYLHDDREMALIFQLIDMRHPPSADDLHMINFLIDSEIPFVIVFTKADKLTKRERTERMEGFAKEIPCFDHIVSIPFSAQTGEGTDEIRKIIQEVVT